MPIRDSDFDLADEILGTKPPVASGVVSAADEILKASSSQQVRMQKSAAADLEARQGSFLQSPFMRTAVVKTGATVGGLAARFTGHEDAANRVHRLAAAYDKAHRELLKKQSFPGVDSVARKTIEIGTEMTSQAPTIGLAAFAGAPAVIGQAALTTADRAYTDALDAGKAPAQAARHAVGMGVIEGGVTAAFQMLGVGGVEKVFGKSAKPAMKAGVSASLKRLGISTGEELTEELSISLAQAMFEDHVTGVQDQGWERFKATAGDVALQTILTSFAYGAPGEVSNNGRMKLLESRGKILQIANEGRAPTRKEWTGMGFSRFSGKTEQARLDAVNEMAGQIQETYLSRLQEPDGKEFDIPLEAEAFMPDVAGRDAAPPAKQTMESALGLTPVAEQQEQQTGPPDSWFDSLEQQQAPEAAPVAPVEPVAAPEAPAPVDTQTEPEAAPEDLTGPRRTLTEELRAEVDLPAMEDATPEERAEWLDRAMERIDADPEYPTKILDEIDANPEKTLTKVEVLAVAVHLRKLKNDLNALRERSQSSDIYEAELARHEISELVHHINLATEKTKQSATEAGRLLNSYGAMLKEDFSFADMASKEAAAKGAPLDAKETAEVAELARTIERNEARIAQLEEEVRTGSVATAIRNVNRKGSRKRVSRKRVQKQKKFRDAKKSFFDAIRGIENIVTSETGALNVDAVLAGIKVVEAAVDLGTTTFAEMWADISQDFTFDSARELFKASWNRHAADGAIQQLSIKDSNVKDLSAHAKKMFRAIVEGGMTDTKSVVDEVTEEMSKVNLNWTRNDTEEAITSTGRFKPPKRSKTTAQKAANVIREQLRLVRELKAIEGGAVPKTAEPSGKVDAKVIADLKARIKTAKENSQNIIDAKARKAEEARIAKMVKDLNDIKSGRVGAPVKRTAEPDSKTVAELKKRIKEAEDLSPVLKQIRADRRTQSYEKSLETQLGKYQEMIRTGDVAPKAKARTPETDRVNQLKHEIDVTKKEVLRRRRVLADRNKTKAQKAWSHVGKTLDTGRTMILSFDLPLMRQGATWAFRTIARGDIGKVKRVFNLAVEAARSDEGLFRQVEEIKNSERYEKYEQMGIDFTDIAVDINHQEELFAGGYLNAWRRSGIPGLSHYAGGVVGMNRAHVAILNEIRRDYADVFMDTMVPGGADNLTQAQAEAIGRFVNVATGRGSLGWLDKHGEVMVAVFLAPKYVTSRFRLLLEMPVRLATGWGETPETRKFMAQEAALTGAGIAAMHTLAYMAKVFMMGEDPDEALPEFDPRSSAAGKIQIGNTSIDPMFGLSQALVFMARVASGQYKQRGSGDIKALRKPWFGEGEGPGFGEFDMKDVFFGFMQSKFSPWLGSTLDLAAKEDIIGREVTAGGMLVGNAVPIPFRDIYKGMRDLGIPAGVAASVLMWTGMGMQTYEERASRSEPSVDPYAVTE
jgi:hypothetical protein